MAISCGGWYWHLGVASFVAMGGVIASSGNCVLAQVTPDGTLGAESSVVTPTNVNGLPGDQIDGGATRGANLFHSFEQFSVPTGGEASFNNALEIQNIISRVTGGSVTNIDGLLRANGTANLFLLNPNGIIFGPNAALSIGGSFVGSTASAVNFADGTSFSTTAPTTSLLTVSVPIGLQYGGNAGSIQVQGNGQGTRTATDLIDTTVGLRVEPNQTLAIVGGDIVLSSGGTLKTAGGRIELGSVAGPGLVSLTPIDSGWALGYEGVPTFGDIQLSGAATVNASGADSGDITVQSRRLTLQDGSRLAAINLGLEQGGRITVNAEESFEITGTGTFAQVILQSFDNRTLNLSNFSNGVFTPTLGPGAAGDVVINTPNFIASNGAFVLASSYGQGQGGNLTVNSEFVELSASVLATTSMLGATGNLTINTGQLIFRDNAYASTSNRQGQGGNLTVRASEFVELIGTDALFLIQGYPLTTGLLTASSSIEGAGDLQVETGRLILRDGATISASTNGNGQGGNITVTASESVKLIGRSPNRLDSTIIAAGTGSASTGSGGKVTIATGNLTVQDGAEVTVISRGTGYAGQLEVVTDSIRLDNGGRLNAESLSGEGGNIRLQVQDLQLRHNSSISTSAGIASGAGNGGNIVINADTLVALENSDIIANAFLGRGGRVSIAAQIFGTEARVQQNPQTSDITASSNLGPQLSGKVEINTTDVDQSLGLVTLPTELVDVSNSFATDCPANIRQGESKFIITGRGGLPPNPRQFLRSNAVQVDWVELSASRENRSSTKPATNSTIESANTQIVEADGWTINDKGEVVLIATAPTATLNIPWLPSSNCNAPEQKS